MNRQYSPEIQSELKRYQAKTSKLLARTSIKQVNSLHHGLLESWQPKAAPTPQPEAVAPVAPPIELKPHRTAKPKTSTLKPLQVAVDEDEAITKPEPEPEQSQVDEAKELQQAIAQSEPEVVEVEPAIAAPKLEQPKPAASPNPKKVKVKVLAPAYKPRSGDPAVIRQIEQFLKRIEVATVQEIREVVGCLTYNALDEMRFKAKLGHSGYMMRIVVPNTLIINRFWRQGEKNQLAWFLENWELANAS